MISLEEMGKRAERASREMNRLGVKEKNRGLLAVAEALTAGFENLMEQNKIDVERARENGMKDSLVDRLALNEERSRVWQRGFGRLPHWRIPWER